MAALLNLIEPKASKAEMKSEAVVAKPMIRHLDLSGMALGEYVKPLLRVIENFKDSKLVCIHLNDN